MKNGLIIIITGPMFSGKTKKLIEFYRNLKEVKDKILVLKPVIDERYSKIEIVSHDGDRIPALAIKEIKEIKQLLEENKEVEIILIDEIQLFFSEEIIKLFDNLAKEGKEIIAAGLAWGSLSDIPISSVAGLLAVADKVIKLTGICDICGENATKTQWKMDYLPQKPSDYVGGAEKYSCRCRIHYTKPQQKLEAAQVQ